MQIEASLAKEITSAAISGPFRQTKCMTTKKLEGWLKDRGIALHWETIHQLWAAGVLTPIAVRADAIATVLHINGSGRFVHVDLDIPGWYLADLGASLSEDTLALPNEDIPYDLREALLWHPYQLIEFHELAQDLKVTISPRTVIQGRQAILASSEFAATWVMNRITSSQSQEHRSSLRRLIGFLIMIDPLVHVDVYGRHTVDPFKGESISGYLPWVRSQDGVRILTDMELTVDELSRWHEHLSFIGQTQDTFGPFASVVRQGSFDARRRLKKNALVAQELYDSASLIRHYLRRYHNHNLPNELDATRIGPRRDHDPKAIRAAARRLGIEYQESVHWFVEGDTEAAYIEAWALLCGIRLRDMGVVVRNVNGLGFFASPQFRDHLEYCQREKVYAYVTVDEDFPNTSNSSHIRELSNYENRMLLPAGYTCWSPNFVTANFSLDELSEIATKVARDRKANVKITSSDIHRMMQYRPNGQERPKPIPVEDAITTLWREAGIYDMGKGKEWGHLLAEWAFNNPLTEDHRDAVLHLDDDKRRITQLVVMLVRARRTDYDRSVELHSKELSSNEG